MSDLQAEVVAAARGWIGTPYAHQASCRGAGADCLGLLRGVWSEVLGQPAEIPPPYTRDWSEVSGEEALFNALKRSLVLKTGAFGIPGDVLLFRMRHGSVAKHLGIQTAGGSAPRFVHAYFGHGVVESPLSAAWARRIVAQFAFPDRRDQWQR